MVDLRESVSVKARLRLSGLLATAVFLVMVVSDLLMLTTLDFSRPYSGWREAPGIPQAQITAGYYHYPLLFSGTEMPEACLPARPEACAELSPWPLWAPSTGQ